MVAALASGVGAAACDGDGSSSSSGTNDRIKNACGLLTTRRSDSSAPPPT
jgi:hypothetical protein